MNNSNEDEFYEVNISPINSKTFSSFFDDDFRLVKEHEFRRAVFRSYSVSFDRRVSERPGENDRQWASLSKKNLSIFVRTLRDTTVTVTLPNQKKHYGVSDDLKETVWKYLFQFYPFNSTPRERAMKNKEKFIEYFLMRYKWRQHLEAIEKNSHLNNADLDFMSIPPMPFDIQIKADTNKNEYCIEDPNVNVDYVKIQTILHISRIHITNSKLLNDIKLIEKDLERTGYLISLDKSENNESPKSEEYTKAWNTLRNILITFCAFNQNIEDFSSLNKINLGYTQGMNELASIFMSIFEQESVAYWCFSNFMLLDSYTTSCIPVAQLNQTHVLKINVAHYFSDVGMSRKLDHLSFLLHKTDPVLYKVFERLELESLLFCHEWLLLYFKRCFSSKKQYQRCLEILSSHFIELHKSMLINVNVKDLYSFDLFICLALLHHTRQEFLNKCETETDIFEVFKTIKEKNVFAENFNLIFQLAEEIFESYCSNFSLLSENLNRLMSSSSTGRMSKRLEKLKGFLFD